jgi:hypothetical protein
VYLPEVDRSKKSWLMMFDPAWRFHRIL